jgi:glycerol-3-phosphate O-acyltransferase 3/4
VTQVFRPSGFRWRIQLLQLPPGSERCRWGMAATTAKAQPPLGENPGEEPVPVDARVAQYLDAEKRTGSFAKAEDKVSDDGDRNTSPATAPPLSRERPPTPLIEAPQERPAAYDITQTMRGQGKQVERASPLAVTQELSTVLMNAAQASPSARSQGPREGLLTRGQTRTKLALQRASESWADLAGMVRGDLDASSDRERVQERFERALMEVLGTEAMPVSGLPLLFAPLTFATEAMEDVVEDEFSRCFKRTPVPAWNWNVYLFLPWVFGVVIRYGILLPLRVLCLVSGSVLFALAFSITKWLYRRNPERRHELERKLIVLYSACWIMSMSGVIAYHGTRPRMRPHAIYVANHSSLIDLIVLQQLCPFATVGQAHGGIVGLLQKHVLECLGCIWFSRDDLQDRQLVRKRIEEHLQKPNVPPLLIFPEGTCVNNEYCLMFKKGAFEMKDAVIYPVAIKYNKLFADAFWNSMEESFLWHLFRIWTSWALVADVYFLEPMKQQPNESAAEFAARVKRAICSAAGLKSVEIDGYYKRMQVSDKYVRARQEKVAQALVATLERVPRGAKSETDIDGTPSDDLRNHRPKTARF